MLNSGYIFTSFNAPEKSIFDKLLEVFLELITHASGDMDEVMDWLKMLDQEYSLTNDEYTLDDFIEELKGARILLFVLIFLFSCSSNVKIFLLEKFSIISSRFICLKSILDFDKRIFSASVNKFTIKIK